jgi:hypothetical protein
VYPQELEQWRLSATQTLAEPEEARASPRETKADQRRIRIFQKLDAFYDLQNIRREVSKWLTANAVKISGFGSCIIANNAFIAKKTEKRFLPRDFSSPVKSSYVISYTTTCRAGAEKEPPRYFASVHECTISSCYFTEKRLGFYRGNTGGNSI